MKKVLLATALSLCVSSAFAAETALLKVTGTLTNSACTPQLSNGGIVDYGTIHLGELSAGVPNQLGHKNIDLTITCTAATKVSWNLVDNKADTNAGVTIVDSTFTGSSTLPEAQKYGVGLTNEGVKIGSYSLFVNVDSVTADGNLVDPISLTDNESAWVKSESGATVGASRRDISVAASGTTDPLAFRNATFPLTTALAIQGIDTLGIKDDTQLDGQLTISLRYL